MHKIEFLFNLKINSKVKREIEMVKAQHDAQHENKPKYWITDRVFIKSFDSNSS